MRTGALLAALTLLFSGCGAGTDVQTQKIGTRTVETAQYAGAETHHTSADNLVFVTSSGLVELYYDSATDSAAFNQGGFRATGITAMNHNLQNYYHTRYDSSDNLDLGALADCFAVSVQVLEDLENDAEKQN